MKKALKAIVVAAAALYPVIVFTLLTALRFPVRILSLFMMVAGAAVFLTGTGGLISRTAGQKSDWRPLLSSALFLTAAAVCFITNKAVFLKLYSVAVNAAMLSVFAGSFFFKPVIIFRFATLADKSIKGAPYENQVYAYCRKVTLVWCVFFVINGSIAAFTALHNFGNEALGNKIWAAYNGGISYFLIAALFAAELLVRKRVDKKMIKAYPFTKFTADSRRDDHILCFEGSWSAKKYRTWRDFLADSAKIRSFVEQRSEDDWILHCEDYWYFLCSFTALLQCKKRIILTQNISNSFIKEIRNGTTAFLTDQDVPDSLSVAALLDMPEPPETYVRTLPAINADKTQILLYTSGSTGRPKAVQQRMTEFEEDNAFVISKWGKEFVSRTLVTTVSQHHIYGFLFGLSLPFTLGVPFRRTRIIYPEEFETLSDAQYMIIATPAFLKRTVEIEDKLPLKKPWIFTSGGALSESLAEKTKAVFGICPLEVYGSTETSGIAYRQQSTDGLAWTPFDNAKIWLGDDGCLRIISPYIKNPEGFATADLAEILENGTFLLRGRSDSIVKIEEKRISVTEVENRLLQTGLISDVKVIALENEVRQYLAAAVALNADGKARFFGAEKYQINRFFSDFLANYFESVVLPKKWRYVDTLPTDAQGKKQKAEIASLFSAGSADGAP